jgi:hypothetical protein
LQFAAAVNGRKTDYPKLCLGTIVDKRRYMAVSVVMTIVQVDRLIKDKGKYIM